MGKQRLSTGVITVLVLFALFVLTFAMVSSWVGWGSMPLEKTPTLFWIMYITVGAGWFILDVAIIVRSADAYKYGRTPLFDIILLASGAVFVGGHLFGPAWTIGRLLQISVSGLMAIQGGGKLIRAYIAKRRQTT